MRIGMFFLVVVMLGGGFISPVAAQFNSPEAYYLAPDANGVRQVWRWSDRAALIQAASDVLTYDVVGGVVVYSSGGQLWRVTGGAAEPMVSLTNGGTGYPAISPDGQQVAYVDGGLWEVALSGGEPRLLFADVPFDGSDINSIRIIRQVQYIDSTRLLVIVGRWEWVDPAIYDLNAGTLTLAPAAQFSRALPLSDGRLALFSDTFIGGSLGLHVARDITAPTVWVAGADIASEPALIADVVELGGGRLRVLGMQITTTDGVARPSLFVLDVDTTTNTITPSPQTALTALSIEVPRLSPDGRFVAGLAGGTPNIAYDPSAAYANILTLYEVNSGTSQTYPELGLVSQFRWAD